ncbi:MAG TPA: transglutaminase family protein [Alphaproteobacteria bacterium]
MASVDNLTFLSAWGKNPDADFPLLDVLWDMAALDRMPDDIMAAKEIVTQMMQALPDEDITSLQEQRDVLHKIIHEKFGFAVDADASLPENIDLVSVVTRRKGLPVALAALYAALAQSKGWDLQGVNFPGHFLLQLGKGQQRLLIDPANGADLQASDLRRLLKETLGVHAELQHSHYQSVTARQWVIRFYNNQKTSFLNQDKVDEALQVVRAVLEIAPHEPRLFYDAAVLATRLDLLKDAIIYWEKFILLSDDKAEKEEARYILSRLQSLLQ